ncbi:uncharacterized protein LOC118437630 [Folsomia candida]|nr:uncharacterized protein LOC118437630 [Folsomia candida]
MLLNLKKQYMTLKLRKLMAVEIIKNRVKGDLKRIVKQMNAQVQSNSKEFVVLGGGTKSLSYLKTPHSSRLGGGSGFTLEVDVRGYIPDNVSVDTANNHMSIRATKVNGVEKALSLLAPSTAALEKVKIYPPTNGFLLIKYPNNEQESAY